MMLQLMMLMMMMLQLSLMMLPLPLMMLMNAALESTALMMLQLSGPMNSCTGNSSAADEFAVIQCIPQSSLLGKKHTVTYRFLALACNMADAICSC